MQNAVAANVLGTLGAVCWSIQLIPQIILNYRRHHPEGLQPTMMMLWAWAGIPLGVYNIASAFNVALQIQPQILTGLSLITWIQCQYYEKNWPLPKAAAVVIPVIFVMTGIEIASVYAVRVGMEQSIPWPLTLMAVLAAVLLALGVLRHYWDIYQFRTVRVISFLFVGLDALGDWTSLLSLFFQERLDVLGLVVYGVELLLWIGVFAADGHYRFIPWLRQKLFASTNSPHHAQPPSLTAPSGSIYLNGMSSSSTSVFHASSGHVRSRNAPQSCLSG